MPHLIHTEIMSHNQLKTGRYEQDIQTWLSEVQTFQQANQIKDKMDQLIQLGSNALALINRVANSNMTDNYQDENASSSPKLAFSLVSKFPKQATKEPGFTREKIWKDKDQIALIGDRKYSTIIVASNSIVKSGSSLYESATFSPTSQQATALYISSDRAVLYRCSVIDYQDSLFAEAFHCDVSGTVDFIFGNAAAVFQNCNLLLRRPVNDNVILANGRNHPEHDSGFSLHRFKITSAHEFYSVRHSYSKISHEHVNVTFHSSNLLQKGIYGVHISLSANRIVYDLDNRNKD
uniref:Pectinesterase n=1 Tax=Kalanchoe fedtschenkoi TaxID=63787 RepID=A0A7N0VCT3_KALFE